MSLSIDEFASLTAIGSGPLLSYLPVTSAHMLKLTGLQFVEALPGGYIATLAGRFRIASGA
jgi:hypothetical protein